MTRKDDIKYLLGIKDDMLFIEESYRILLERRPDPDGINYIMAAIRTGTSKKTIINSMHLSPEAAELRQGHTLLSGIEKMAIRLWMKGQAIYSWLNALRHLSDTRIQTAQLLIQIRDLRESIIPLQERVMEKFEKLKAQVLYVQNMEAQAQQRRLDQFFFDSRQAFKPSPDEKDIQRLESISEHGIDRYYIALEESFRGSRDAILNRCQSYLDLVKNRFLPERNIRAVDLGCGRGEWLQILTNHYPEARGVDSNSAMVAECRSHGLWAEQGDLIQWIQTQPDCSLDLITAFHVIEHLSFKDLNLLMAEANRLLAEDGMLLIETPNPDNLYTAANMFYRDPTHRHPIPKELASHLLTFHGLADIEIIPLHPFPESMRLPEDNELSRRFNDLIYGAQDYVIIARKSAGRL